LVKSYHKNEKLTLLKWQREKISMRTQKRTRKFLPLWKNKRPWLMHMEETKLMFCTYSYCEDQGKNGSFVSRCNNFRVDALNAHVGKGNFSSDLEEKIIFLINILLFQIHSECRV
jgi:hypothetical protein